MSAPRVLNMRHGERSSTGAVYVGRPSKWGNPFRLDHESQRDEVLALYRGYLAAHPQLVAEARRELRGKDLLCWCAPKACHADVLLEVANTDAWPFAA